MPPTLHKANRNHPSKQCCRLLVGVSLILNLSACSLAPLPKCKTGEQLGIQDALYFGTATADGVISPIQWMDFLNTHINPRFPNGFSVLPATGQWQDQNGRLVQEMSYLLQLIHPDDNANETKILAIINTYKAQFKQQAVLRVTTPVCFGF